MTLRHPYITPAKSRSIQRVIVPDGIQPTNTKLFTNPIPVNNSAGLVPSTRIRLSVGRDYLQNVALYPNPIPINDSWNLLGPNARVRVTASDASDASEMWLFPPIGSTINWGRQFDVPLVAGQAYQSSLALNNVVISAAPFFTQDWSKPYSLKPVVPDQNNLLNFALYNTTAVVTATVDPRTPFITRTFFPAPNRSDPVGPNLALNTIVAGTPFVPVDFQKPFVNLGRLVQDQTLLLFFPPAPFVPADFSTSKMCPDWLPAPLYPNIALLNSSQVVTAPFYQTDFPKPFFPRAAKLDQQQYNSAFYPNPIPFAKYDWAVQDFQNPRAPDASVSINPNLFTNPAPFAQYDWSKTQFLTPRAPDASVAPNLNFYTNPIPFAQYEWAKISFQTPRAPDASQLTNPNLYPPVFVPPVVDDGSTVLSDRKAGGGYYPRKKWEALLEEIRLEKAALATPTKSKSARDAVARAKRAAAEAAEQLERNQAEELARNVVSAERASKAVEAIRLANEIVENANALIYDEDEAEEKLIRLLLGTL